MFEILFWLYLINATLLIVHEIDSAYWKEWELFKLPGREAGFLIIHIPIVMIVLYGLPLVYHRTLAGFIISLVLSLSGIFAFVIHRYFISKGHKEFTNWISQWILKLTLLISLAQLVLKIYLLA
jgi:hypothetical protein